MQDNEVTWHTDQATVIAAYEESIKTGEVHLAQIWWEVGERLNYIYGANTTGKADKETEIPLMDLNTLGDIYKSSSIDGVRRTMNRARKFHRAAPSIEQRDAAIQDFGTWTNIYERFCAGLSPHVITRNGENAHMMNVPDMTVLQVANKLGSMKEARKAIRYFMQVADADSVVNIYLQQIQPYAASATR